MKFKNLNIVVNRKSALTNQIAFNDIIVEGTYPMAIGVSAKRVISSIPPNGKPCATQKIIF